VESEEHFLLDCYVYFKPRQNMFKTIKDSTGYDLVSMKGDPVWMLDVMLGHGLPKKETRRLIGMAVSVFIAVAMRVRARILGQVGC